MFTLLCAALSYGAFLPALLSVWQTWCSSSCTYSIQELVQKSSRSNIHTGRADPRLPQQHVKVANQSSTVMLECATTPCSYLHCGSLQIHGTATL